MSPARSWTAPRCLRSLLAPLLAFGLAITGVSIGSRPAAAEGSATLLQSGGYRPFLEYRNDLTQNSTLHRRTVVKAYANAGDTLLIASSANGVGGGRLRWRSPSGSAGLAPVSAGRILTLAAELAGPLPASGGYAPYAIPVGAGDAGVWEIDFVSPDSTSDLNPPQVPVGNVWSQRADVGYVCAWDVTVRSSAGLTQPGRVYVNQLAMNMGGPSASLSSQIYVLTRDGYRYRVDANSVQPFGFNLFANNKGFTDANGIPLYHSVELAGARVHDPDAADTPADATHKIFFSAPAADLPASAQTPSGSTWLLTTPFVATVSNFRFTGIDGTVGWAASGIGGNFTFQSTGAGNFIVRIDLDGNNVYNDPIDRALVGVALPGTNSIAWDGYDGLGNRAASSGNPSGVSARVTLLGGEIHFPYVDAENNANGIVIERQSGASAPDYTVYYDDRPIGGTSSLPPAGENSATGGHRWTGFLGDIRGMDTWAYVPGANLELVTQVIVRDADLELVSKTHAPEPLVAGQPMTWTLVARNNGPDSVYAAAIIDTVSSAIGSLSVANAVHVGGTILSAAFTGQVFTASVDLPPGGTATFTLAGTVSPVATGPILNRALALRGDDQGDADDPLRQGAGNNSKRDTASVVNAVPDMAIAKTHTGNFVAGLNAVWNIRVDNVGTGATTGAVTVRDTLGAGNTFVSGAGAGWVISHAAGVVTATHAGLFAVGDSSAFTITVALGAAAIPATANYATVSTPGDSDPGNDRDGDSVPVSGRSDLTLDKSHTAPFAIGSNGTWNFRVTNLGPAATFGEVAVIDTLPAGVTYVSGFGEGWIVTQSGGIVIARQSALILPNGTSDFRITVAVDAAAYPSVANAAVVTNGGDDNPDNNRDTDIVPVTGVVDLVISKTHTPAVFQAGSTGQYTISVSNIGNIPSSGTITVRDTLPAGLTFVSAAPGAWSVTNAGAIVTATTTASLLPAAPPSSFDFTVSVALAAAPGVTNAATVYGGGDSDTLNNRALDPATVLGLPDVALDKAHTGNFTVGDPATWRFVVSNVGNAPTSGAIVVRDTLPAGITFTSASGAGWTFSAVGQVVTATHPGVLAINGTSLFSIVVAVGPSAAPGVVNSATASTPGDPNTSNDRDTDPAVVSPLPDLTIDKSHTGSFTIGGSGTWTIAVTNIGAGPTIAQPTVTDTLPAGVTFLSGTGTNWTVSSSNGIVSASYLGVLAPNASASFTVTVAVTAGAYPQVVNTAQVDGDDTPGNNRDTDTVPVLGSANLVIDKRHTSNFTAPGTGAWTFVLRNIGNLPTSGVITVRDTLPAGVSYAGATAPGFTVTASGAIVTATTPAVIAVGDSTSFSITVDVTPAAVPSVTNAAVVEGGGDHTPDDNRDVDPTPVSGTPDLALNKTHTDVFRVGFVSNWRIEVSNVGTVSTTGPITVRDTLPAGVTFNSAAGNGWTFSTSGQVVTATRVSLLAPGGLTFFTIAVDIDASAAPGVVNAATANTSGDLNPANDRDTDPTPVNALPDLAMFKRHSGDLSVGGTTMYTLTVRNVGQGSTFDIATVLDTLPAGVAFLNETGKSSWTVQANGRIVTGSYSGILAPGDSSSFSFLVSVDAAAAPNVTNWATVFTPGDPNDGNDRAGDRAPVGFRSLLAIEKSASTSNAQIGDVVDYAVRVRNDGNVIVPDVVVDDRLPAGFVYVSGTARVDGVPVAEPAGAPGPQLKFAVGAVGVTKTATLTYRLAIGAGAHIGRGINVAVASSVLRGQTSPPASAAVDVRGGVFEDEGIIAGKLFVDCDCAQDGTQGHEELGIPGVRVTLEDGTSAITDVEGKFHFANVRPRTHVLRVDGSTLPAGAKLAARTSRHAGDGLSQFIDLHKGEFFRADFAEVSKSAAVLAEVKARRERGEIGGGTGGDGGPGQAGDGGTGGGGGGAPAKRAFFLDGLVEGRVDWRGKSDDELGWTGRDRFMDEFGDAAFDSDSGKVHGGARGALYGRGTVGSLGDLTLRYDSEADHSQRLFRDIRPGEGYDVFGDASITEFDARSRSRLYARLDRGVSWALFGDLATSGDANRQLGAFSRSLTGGALHAGNSHASVGGFASLGRAHQAVDEIPGRGISGPYALSRTDGVLNSERVELVTRDRNQPARVLARTAMTRFADYTLEPFTGRLLFRRPVPSVDMDLNPVSIRVTYEIESAGDAYWVAGGEAGVTAGALHVAGAMVRDDDPSAPRDLASVDATLSITTGVTLAAEFARSDSARGGFDSDNTDAVRGELAVTRGALNARAWALRVDRGFDNPSSSASPGREELGGTARVALGKGTHAFATALRTTDLVNDGQRQGLDAGLAHALNPWLTAEAAYRRSEETNAPATGVTAGVTPLETNSLRGKLTALLPGRTHFTAFGEFEQDLDVTDQRRAALGLEAPIGTHVRFYARHELISSWAGPFALNADQRRTSTIVGFSSDELLDTHVFSEYRARDAFSGRDAQAAFGLRNRWQVRPGLKLDASFERVADVNRSGGTGDYHDAGDATAITGALEYTASPLWKATVRSEYADGADERWFLDAGAARKLDRDWTALARALHQDVLSRRQGEDLLRVGLAYRQTDNNRLNLLARFETHETREDVNALALAGVHRRLEHIVSTHANWQMHRSLTLAAQLAGRWVSDEQPGAGGGAFTDVQLASGRVLWEFAPRWDAGASGRGLFSHHAREKQFGTGVELGRTLARNLRGALGWNAFGFRSSGLAGVDVTDAGPFVTIGWKFDESLFGAVANGGEAK